MIRIGMIGADSSHTEAFAGLMNPPGAPLHGRAQVVKLWGADRAQAEQKAAQCHIPQVVDEPADALAGVDAAMICNRFGDDHPPYARLAIQVGLPTFVDKPLANDLATAREIVQLATTHGVPLMSCSAVRFAPELLTLQEQQAALGEPAAAVATGPAVSKLPDPRARHPFFYGIHAVELLHALLGPGAQAVTTQHTSRCDVGVVRYPDGRQGVVNLLYDTPGVYHGVLYGTEGWRQADIRDYTGFYRETLTRFVALAESGQVSVPTDWTLEVLTLLTAVVRSAEQGGQTVELGDL